MRNTLAVRAAIIGAAMAAIPTFSHAQTSGSWVVNTDGNWSDVTKWSPAVPGSGGVATFNQRRRANSS